MWIFVLAALLAADDSPAVMQARQQLATVRQQAAEGLVPAAAVGEAQESLEDAADQELLDRTLYAHLKVEDLSGAQADEMVGAAARRVARTRRKLDRIETLVEQGVAEKSRAVELGSELAAREQALAEARSRAALVRQIVAMATEEADPQDQPVEWKAKEHFTGDGEVDEDEIREITLAFEKQFREPFPVSARGETAVHRALGFDHTGRVDVAVTPDSKEGVWLRKYLEDREIPYYAFRVAIPGKATAPHIHIGPASTRLRLAD
jgi:hypothetical protein